jgi:hypothetical protein
MGVTSRTAVLFCAWVAVTAPVAGQYTGTMGMTFNNAGSALASTFVTNAALAQAFRKQVCADAARRGQKVPAECTASDLAAARGPVTAASPRGEPSVPAARRRETARSTFTPVGERLMVGELARTFARDNAAERREFEGAFEQFIADFEQQVRRDQEPANDVGRAAAYFVVLNYFAATGEEPDDAQADAVQRQMRALLADSDGFARMADGDRQRLYETLIVLGSIPLTAVMQAGLKSPPEDQSTFREFAGVLFKTLLGVSVQQIRMTSDGLTILQ